MTDADLLHAVEMYWKTRGTADGPGWWRAISAEMRRRKRRLKEVRREAA